MEETCGKCNITSCNLCVQFLNKCQPGRKIPCGQCKKLFCIKHLAMPNFQISRMLESIQESKNHPLDEFSLPYSPNYCHSCCKTLYPDGTLQRTCNECKVKGKCRLCDHSKKDGFECQKTIDYATLECDGCKKFYCTQHLMGTIDKDAMSRGEIKLVMESGKVQCLCHVCVDK